MDNGNVEGAVIGSNEQCSIIQQQQQNQQQQTFIGQQIQQQHQLSLSNNQPGIQLLQSNEQSNSIEVLLNELRDIKIKVCFLQEENANLIQFKNQMLAECSEIHGLKSRLAAADSEITRLLDQTQRQREYIISLECAGSPTHENPRKSAKKSQEDRLINRTIDPVNLGHNLNFTHLENNAAATPVVSNNNNKTNNTNIGADCSASGGINSHASNNSQVINKKKLIQVIDTDLQTVKEKIKSANCKNFTLRQNSRNGPIKFAITNSNEIPKIRDSLTNNRLSFHEYKWQEEKWKCFVLRGLVGATIDDIPHIKQELLNAGLPDSIILVPLFTGYMRANPEALHSSLFKLIVPPEFDVKLLLGIKYLDHVAVKFEVLKKNRVMQCKNCQRFGHSAGGCQHPHRCVKFGENHFRDDCPRTHNKANKLKCCNCSSEHTANNLLECQYFLQRYAKNNTNTKVPNKQAANENIHTGKKLVSDTAKRASPSTVTPGLSFAQVTGNHLNSISHSPNRNSTNIEHKIDMLIQLVSRHDAILEQLINNG